MGDLYNFKQSPALLGKDPILLGYRGIMLPPTLLCGCIIRGAFRDRRGFST